MVFEYFKPSCSLLLQGDPAVAAASAHHNSLYCLSSLGTTSMTDICLSLPPGHPKLLQLYIWRDKDMLKEVLAMAEKLGFHAIALTVDHAWYGNRERNLRTGFTIPPDFSARQVWEACRRPAWTWDFLAHPPYK